MTVKQLNTPSFTLPNGKIPAIGYGTGTKWKKSRDAEDQNAIDEGLSNAVSNAIQLGITHIDTAEFYLTHREVAHGIKKSGIDRSKIWITDKYTPGYRSVKAPSKNPYEAVQTALRELETDYIDLYLIHTPEFNPELSHGVTMEQAWKDFEKAYKEGLVKNIGVSNFDVKLLEKLFEIAEIKPSVLQVEFHAYLYDQTPGIIEFAKKHNIRVEAYGPLTPIIRASGGPLDTVLRSLSDKYNKTEAQLLLRWVYEQGVLPITTSSNEKRITDALDIFEFEFAKEDVDTITKIGAGHKFRAFFQEFEDIK